MSDEEGSDSLGDSPEITPDSGQATEAESEHNVSFPSYQLFVFVSCYFGYVIMLYNMKSFTFTLPYIMGDKYFSSYEIGLILGAQTVTYTISKFFVSWATDHYSPRLMFGAGLFCSGLFMLAFSDQDDWPNIMLLTTFNGIAQGLGWPTVTKMIRAWYPPTQFGLWFALLSTASNLTGIIGPGVAYTLAATHGWRAALQYPAMLAILLSAVVPFTTWDNPSDVGYEDQLTLGDANDGHWSDLAGSDFLLLLASTFGMLRMITTSYQGWGKEYLVQERGLSDYSASTYLASLEFGGMIGVLTVGAITDVMIAKGYYLGTGKSPRMILVQLSVASTFLLDFVFLLSIDPDTGRLYTSTIGFLLGFCMFGSTSLLSTIALEIAPIHMTGSTLAVIGLASNIGAMAGGVPVEYLAKSWGWFAALMIINSLCMCVFGLLIFGKDIKATFQQTRRGPPKIRKLL